MKGLMMDYPLTLQSVMERAYRLYPRKEIATKMCPEMHRYTYADFYPRSGQLANALARLGIQRGDRIGTLAWNTYRHLELYFAVPCMGAVVHTLNLRLPPNQLTHIINHAEDQVIFVDHSLLPILEKVAGDLKTVRHVVVMGEGPLSEVSLPNVLSYEELLPPSRPITPGPSRARTTLPRCATPLAPQVTPRACCVLTGPCAYTP